MQRRMTQQHLRSATTLQCQLASSVDSLAMRQESRQHLRQSTPVYCDYLVVGACPSGLFMLLVAPLLLGAGELARSWSSGPWEVWLCTHVRSCES